jgi:chaperonin GroES
VLAVGPGSTDKHGVTVTLSVRVGDKVLFGQHAGQKVKVEGNEVTILREEDIMAIVN